MLANENPRESWVMAPFRGTTRDRERSMFDSHFMCNNIYSFGSWICRATINDWFRWTVLLVTFRFKFTSNKHFKWISNWILRKMPTVAIHVGGWSYEPRGWAIAESYFSFSDFPSFESRSKYLLTRDLIIIARRQLKLASWKFDRTRSGQKICNLADLICLSVERRSFVNGVRCFICAERTRRH